MLTVVIEKKTGTITHFFYKRPVYKQPAMGSKNHKQLLELNLFSINNSEQQIKSYTYKIHEVL